MKNEDLTLRWLVHVSKMEIKVPWNFILSNDLVKGIHITFRPD